MSELTPTEAAFLAENIYDVQNEKAFKKLLNHGIFSQKKGHQQKLNADIGGRIIRKARDGFGLCAMGGGAYFTGDAFFIFRGTTTAHNNADMISDARIGTQMSKTGTAVHIGFNEVFKSMLEEIRQFVKGNKITGTIHCVGHSLGGAVATLAADWLKSNTGRTVKLYTFGQPRVGMTFFSAKLTAKLGSDNIHRVFHTTDPVPMVPIFPYTHSPLPGNGHLIESSSLIISGDAHKMDGYVKDVKNKQWINLKLHSPVYDYKEAVEQLLKSTTKLNPEHPRTWEWLDKILLYILKKIGNGIFVGLHTTMVGIHSLADRIAWILAKGINLAQDISRLVELFVKKVMQVLNMAPLIEGQSITQSFLASLLTLLMRRAHSLAKRAIQAV